MLPWLFVMCFLVKYSMKIIDTSARYMGYRYVQLWNNGRTVTDKVLESLMLHVVSIIYTLALQMTYCTMYLAFWRQDHFIIQYIPMLGLALSFVALMMMVILLVTDRIRGWMVNAQGNRYLFKFWTFVVIMFGAFFVPMIGYSMASVHFMWTVKWNGWLAEEEIFSPLFVYYANRATYCALAFMAIAVVDIAVIFAIDLEEH